MACCTCGGGVLETVPPTGGGVNPTYPSFEVTAQIGGNLAGADARIGFYQFDKLYNGVAAYTNSHYFIYYFGNDYGWQWTPQYDGWAGNGPQLDLVPTAQDFVEHSQFLLAGGPTSGPTPGPTPGGLSTTCSDVTGWHDSDGADFDCEWYFFGNGNSDNCLIRITSHVRVPRYRYRYRYTCDLYVCE
jgi:hypothetical protein